MLSLFKIQDQCKFWFNWWYDCDLKRINLFKVSIKNIKKSGKYYWNKTVRIVIKKSTVREVYKNVNIVKIKRNIYVSSYSKDSWMSKVGRDIKDTRVSRLW